MKIEVMDLRWCDLLATSARAAFAILFGFWLVGCVGLDKPQSVADCLSSPAGCSDNSTDARSDVRGANLDQRPDLRSADEPALPGKDDASSGAQPDVPADEADARVGKDVPGDQGYGTDGLEAFDLPLADVPSLAEAGSDLARDQGLADGPSPGIDGESAPESGPEPGPEPPRDGGSGETSTGRTCSIVSGATPATGIAGHPDSTNSKDPFCVVTCDDIQGWGCSNFDGRVATVNGTAVTCGGAITKKNGYYVFDISAGASNFAIIYWWGTYNATCPLPDGGFDF